MSPLALGARGRCPRCGEGRLFAGAVRFAPRCERCGLDLTAFNVDDGPAPFLILIVGALCVGGVLWLQFSFAPPWWAHLMIWPPIVITVTIGLLRVAKGALLALEYRHRAAEHRFR